MAKRYTVRFAHLEYLPDWQIGDIIFEDDKIGRMGTSGQSVFPHVHIDVVEGFVDRLVYLMEIGYEAGKLYIPNIKQLNFFIDEHLFHYNIYITTPFYDPQYKIDYKKDHPAYDVVPLNRKTKPGLNFDIFWNRSKKGTVLKTGFDKYGYGYYILIGFEA